MPVYAKLAAEPLQTINADVLQQTLRRLNARAQTPADYILELLLRDTPGTTLLIESGAPTRPLKLAIQLVPANAKHASKLLHLIRGVSRQKLILVALNVPNRVRRNA